MSTKWPWGQCSVCGGDLDPSGACFNFMAHGKIADIICTICNEPSDCIEQSEDGFDLCPDCGFTDDLGRRWGSQELMLKYNA